MRDAKERKHFGAYINKLRLQLGFQLEQTGDGLCTEQMLSYLENGKKTAPKLLQDALLERLGVGAEDYEHYLDYRGAGAGGRAVGTVSDDLYQSIQAKRQRQAGMAVLSQYAGADPAL